MKIELFYLNSTLYFGILLVLVFQLEVDYKVGRLLTGPTAQQKGTTDARWYSNKTSLLKLFGDNNMGIIIWKLQLDQKQNHLNYSVSSVSTHYGYVINFPICS